jgi:adenylylsulfate kinase
MAAVIWFYGISGSGKTTAAHSLHKQLLSDNINSAHLDADDLRYKFWPELGVSREARLENTKRITLLAKEFSDLGVPVVVSAVAAFTEQRANTLNILPHTKFVLVDTPVGVCKQRKPHYYKDADSNKVLDVDAYPLPWATLDGTVGLPVLYKYVSNMKSCIISSALNEPMKIV